MSSDFDLQVTILSEAAVRAVIDWQLAIDAVHEAFCAASSGRSMHFPTLAARGAEEGELVNIKFGLVTGATALLGHKTGTYWPMNAGRGLANHGATTLLLDPRTGRPHALVNASLLNRYRTAAADAVAVRALARPDSEVLAVIGAGAQAEYEVRAVTRVRAIRTVRLASRTRASAEHLRARLADLSLGIDVTDPESAVRGADVVITVTPARSAVLDAGWVAEGVHVSAMGSDRRGKQELDPALTDRGRLFADDPDQSLDIGEFQHLSRSGVAGLDRITAIGAVLSGERPGRRGPQDITIFDSSGLAVQDLFVAAAVLRRASERGLCRTISM